MRPILTVVAVVFATNLAAIPVAAQGLVLRVTDLSAPAAGMVVITLASGKQITVPTTDVNMDATLDLLNAQPAPNPLPEPERAQPAPNPLPEPERAQPAPNPLSEPERAQPPSSNTLPSGATATAMIEKRCADQWGTDNLQMREYCEERQREGLTGLWARLMNSTAERTIRRQCASQWPEDLTMRNVCEQQQILAVLQELWRH